MQKIIFKYSWRIVLVVLLQVVVVSKVQVHPLINLTPYIALLLILPVQMPAWLLMLIAFFTGLSVDVFENTPGMHAAACVLIAYVRKYLLAILNPRVKEGIGLPDIRSQGLAWFAGYVVIPVLLHQFVYSLLEAGGFMGFGWLLLKVLLGTLFTLPFVIMYDYIFGVSE